MTRAEVTELLKCIQLCLFNPSAVFFNALVWIDRSRRRNWAEFLCWSFCFLLFFFRSLSCCHPYSLQCHCWSPSVYQMLFSFMSSDLLLHTHTHWELVCPFFRSVVCLCEISQTHLPEICLTLWNFNLFFFLFNPSSYFTPGVWNSMKPSSYVFI